MAARTETVGEVATRKRPNPQIAQIARTFYFLRKNTLAMVGLGIIIFFIFVAVASFFLPGSNTQLDLYCGSYIGQGGVPTNTSLTGACQTICTYPNTMPAPQPNCYPVDAYNPSILGPTFNPATLQAGPVPLGAMTVSPANAYFYNIYQGLVKGAPWSLGISAGIVVSGALIGLALGAVAGYKGGAVDEIIMRITDIFLSIPSLLFVLVVLAVFAFETHSLESRVLLLMGAFILVWWPFYTRLVRGQVLVIREQKYVEAARASGAGTARIVGRHIIPNSLYPMFVQMSLDVGSIPLLVGGLVFLGFNVFPTQFFPEWGSISAQSVGVLQPLILLCQIETSCTFPWWQILFPGVTVFMFAISVNFLSDGLRDALDPRLRR